MYPVGMAGGDRRSYGCPYRCHGLVDAVAVELLVGDAAGRQLPFEVPDPYRAAFFAELFVRVALDSAGALVFFTWCTDRWCDAVDASLIADAVAR